jgi:hypothetical protein|nr:MAG TPA: hypothetical protein [Caudoviricetes sp.]
MVSEAQKRSSRKYIKNNTKLVSVRVNKKLEPEVLEWLESKPSMGGYILELIRADMEAYIEKEGL